MPRLILCLAVAIWASAGGARPLEGVPRPMLRPSELMASPSAPAVPRPKPRPEALSSGAPASSPEPAETAPPDFEAWLRDFRPRAAAAGIGPATLRAALSGLRPDPEVIARDRNQAEFTKTIWDYLDTAVSDTRIANGRAALARHAPLLDEIAQRHGVRREIVVAVWGLESAFGAMRGNHPVIAALATLAADRRRGSFFEAQLLDALRILQAGDIDPARMRGSWAGAMGHTQFMPSSYLRFAVDHDGDGRRDIWSDPPADALASTAAYLAGNGWQSGVPWGIEVRLPQGFDYLLADREIRKSPAEWAQLGITPAAGGDLAALGPASVLLPAGAAGPAFLISANFKAIESYNSADSYVIAIGHLADRIAGGGPIANPWPRSDRALTYDERRALQERLTAQGFSTQGIDGKMGPLTIAAIRRFQSARGLIPDGYPSLALLQRLR